MQSPGRGMMSENDDSDLTDLKWLQNSTILITDRVCEISSGMNDKSLQLETTSNVTTVAPLPLVDFGPKPPFSFASLICMAIESSPQKALPVKMIYSWIQENFPFYRFSGSGWKNTVRHNLSLRKCFKKIIPGSEGKGVLWSIDPRIRPSLRRSMRKAGPLFCPMESGKQLNQNIPIIIHSLRAPAEIDAIHSMLTLSRQSKQNSDRNGDIKGQEHGCGCNSAEARTMEHQSMNGKAIAN